MRTSIMTGVALVAVLLFLYKASAAGNDLHWLWDNQCAECHGHSGDFARKFLKADGGQLEGRHHTEDLRGYMRNHYASEIEVDAIYEMLLAQTQTEPRFKQETIVLQKGVPLSRKSGQDIRRFMDQHRGLQKEDAEFFTALLYRIAREVFRP
jgi:hypothetical protein